MPAAEVLVLRVFISCSHWHALKAAAASLNSAFKETTVTLAVHGEKTKTWASSPPGALQGPGSIYLPSGDWSFESSHVMCFPSTRAPDTCLTRLKRAVWSHLISCQLWVHIIFPPPSILSSILEDYMFKIQFTVPVSFLPLLTFFSSLCFYLPPVSKNKNLTLILTGNSSQYWEERVGSVLGNTDEQKSREVGR